MAKNPLDPNAPEDPPPAAPAASVPVDSEATVAIAEDGEPDDGRATFVVTHRAGPRVAGQRVKPQQHIRLTEAEAQNELLAGSIVRKGEKLHEQLTANAKPRTAEEKAA